MDHSKIIDTVETYQEVNRQCGNLCERRIEMYQKEKEQNQWIEYRWKNVETMLGVLVLDHIKISEEDKHDWDRKNPQILLVAGNRQFPEEIH